MRAEVTLLEFVHRHFEDEWGRLVKEFSTIPDREFVWQPAPRVHSIAWHVRHVIEWRYALVHVLLCREESEESLTCLGWENEPVIQAISSVNEWSEPIASVEDCLKLLHRVRKITDLDIRSLDPNCYWETVRFPWRTNSLLDEAFQDVRHSALHRGHVRELRKQYRLGDGAWTEGLK